MGTVTIRNLDDGTIERIKASAKAKGCSMEQEVRDLLEARYADRKRTIERIRKRRKGTRGVTSAKIEQWEDLRKL